MKIAIPVDGEKMKLVPRRSSIATFPDNSIDISEIDFSYSQFDFYFTVILLILFVGVSLF